MSTTLSDTPGVRARKRYRCCFCCEVIAAGTLYNRRTGVDSGDMWTMHMHPECDAYANEHLSYEDFEMEFTEGEPTFDRPVVVAAVIASSSPTAPGGGTPSPTPSPAALTPESSNRNEKCGRVADSVYPDSGHSSSVELPGTAADLAATSPSTAPSHRISHIPSQFA